MNTTTHQIPTQLDCRVARPCQAGCSGYKAMMPLSAPQLLHMFLGMPPVTECLLLPPDAGCWCCGGRGYPRGQDATKWTANSMTDQNQCRDPGADYVCEACVYVRSRSSPVPGRLPGPCSACKGVKPESCKKCEGSGRNSAGGNFRNYTHMFDRDAPTPYISASKGEKPTILAWLRGKRLGPWFAAIADSGQKQVLPYAPVNAPGSRGKVLFDDTSVVLPDKHGWRLVDDMISFLTVGATKEEIARGEYNASTWTRCRAAIELFERNWSSHRGGSFFTLAIWLAQRDETLAHARIEAEKETARAKEKANATRRKQKGKTQDLDCGGTDRVSAAVPCERGITTEPLGHPAKQEPVSSSSERDHGPVGVAPSQGPATSSPRQGSLFGDSGPDDVRSRTRKRR